ncbi:MAG: NUDIX domain-containing protein, partial [Pseudomonadota bacterium]
LRELKEETNLNATLHHLISINDKILKKPKRHFVLMNFLATRPEGLLKSGSDAKEVCWVHLDHLVDYDLTDELFDVIESGYHAYQKLIK